MKKRKSLAFLALLLCMSLIAAACGGDDEEEPSAEDTTEESSDLTGGTLLAETADFGFTSAFDPSGEYLGVAWGLYSNLLTRTLVTYNHVAGAEGNVLVPDLATDLPEISEDGLTYTFTLKDGVKFGPPLSREITSQDVAYAFQRMATESVAAQYAFYYTDVIEGFAVAKKPKPISGIETPDDKTIVFTLAQPTGDFLYRLAMPATSPMPEEVAGCFNKAGEYGRYVIASGPYMLEGSDELDASSCDTLEPISGYDPNKVMIFVRNPDYDPATDSPESREALFDRMELAVNTNVDDIFNRIEAGEIDISPDNPTPKTIAKFSRDSELQDQLQSNGGDRTWYLTMNLTQPPFDDIHVRKAVNLVMDKEGIHKAWGGDASGAIATHILPPEMTGGTPSAEEYDPYPSEGFSGDEAAAKEEMSQSKYDTDSDGVCDAPECSGLIMINRNVPPWTDSEVVVVDSLSKIGIEVEPRPLESSTAYTTIQTVKRNIPIALNAGWGKDYADPSTFMVLFDGGSIIPEGNINYSLVGLTPDLAAEVGAEGVLEGIPDIEDDINACNELADQERTDCWIALDAKLMEEVVPWVPYLWANNNDIISDNITQYGFDQFSGEPAYAHIAVDRE